MNSELFFQEVYSVVSEIPHGKVITYGQIAKLIGMPNHARFVGQAMRHVPQKLNLPCHRVVNSSGRIAPVWHEQRKLLEDEGVRFRENGCVDMEKHTWQLDKLLTDEGSNMVY